MASGDIVVLEHAGGEIAHGVGRVSVAEGRIVHKCVFKVSFPLSAWTYGFWGDYDETDWVEETIDALNGYWEAEVPSYNDGKTFTVVSGNPQQHYSTHALAPHDGYIDRYFYLFLTRVDGVRKWMFAEVDWPESRMVWPVINCAFSALDGGYFSAWTAPFRNALLTTPTSGSTRNRGQTTFTPMSRGDFATWWGANSSHEITWDDTTYRAGSAFTAPVEIVGGQVP